MSAEIVALGAHVLDIQGDVDVVGLSSLAGGHLSFLET